MKAVRAFYDATIDAFARGVEPPDPTELLARLDGFPTGHAPLPAVIGAGAGTSQTPEDGTLTIALVCREYPPETSYGGMATYTYHLAHGLADAGHRVTVITAGRPSIRLDHDDRVHVVQFEPKLPGYRDSFVDLNRRGWIEWSMMIFLHSFGALRVIREIEAARGPFDLIDLADHGGEGVAPAVFWAGPNTVRLYSPWSVLAAMDAIAVSSDEARAIPILESELLHRAGIITSPSTDLAARVRTFFDLEREISIVPDPIDTEIFRPAETQGNPIRVCFVGRLEERKGIQTLMEAIPLVLEQHPGVEFDIIGSDPESRESTVRPMDRDRVRFRGQIALSEVPGALGESSIAVVPSIYDNSPFTCIEAMSCGIPVVGAAVGGIRECLIDGRTGILVKPRDPFALAEAINRLVSDEPLRRSLGSAARMYVEEHFAYRAVTEQMVSEYRRAICAWHDAEYVDGSARERMSQPVSRFHRELNLERPERNAVDVVVLGGISDGDSILVTIDSALDQGSDVTVIWDGPVAVSFPGARTTGTSGAPGSDAARVLSTLLGQCFVVLRAGETLTPRFLDRALRSLAATGDAAVVIDGRRAQCTAAARGLRLADASSWNQVLDRVAARS